jgi:hypothetical protein
MFRVPTVTTPETVTASYERGILTKDEALFRLFILAIEFEPAAFATQMPAEWLADIRERTRNIPTPEELLFLFGGMWVGSMQEYAALKKSEKECYVAGLMAWKAYFDSDRVNTIPKRENTP